MVEARTYQYSLLVLLLLPLLLPHSFSLIHCLVLHDAYATRTLFLTSSRGYLTWSSCSIDISIDEIRGQGRLKNSMLSPHERK